MRVVKYPLPPPGEDMAHTRRPQHPNAALTPTQRLKMVRLVGDGWSVAAAAQRFQVDDKTTRKWLDRYRCEGEAGMGDRSSRPCHSPRRTPEPQRQQVIELRRRTRRGAGFIAHVCAMHASTVHRTAHRRDWAASTAATAAPDRRPNRCATSEKTVRVHVDQEAPDVLANGRGTGPRRGRAGGALIDDRTRLGYSEIGFRRGSRRSLSDLHSPAGGGTGPRPTAKCCGPTPATWR